MNDNWILTSTGQAVHSFQIDSNNKLVYDTALPVDGTVRSISLGALIRGTETLAVGMTAWPYVIFLAFDDGTFGSLGSDVSVLPQSEVWKVQVAKTSPVIAAVTAINQPPSAASQFVWQHNDTSWIARTVPAVSTTAYIDHSDVAISGDGNVLAVPFYFNNSSAYGYRIYRLSGSTYELIYTITDSGTFSCALNSTGQYLITGSTSISPNAALWRFNGLNYVKLKDLDTGATTPTTVKSIAFSPNDDYFVIAMPNKVIFYSFDTTTAAVEEVFLDDTITNAVSVSIGGQGTKIAVACNQSSNALILYGKLT